MKSKEIREKFLKFFKEKRHAIIPSASLIPENDPSVLFTTAGMHPLVPYLLGEPHPLGKRLVNIQKCLRTNDINEVGNKSHLTFFEMPGYWSLGDYFKKESIHFTFDFYTEIINFNKNDFSVTVFEGDETAPFDEESYDVWKNEIGIPTERIYRYPKKENWWGPVGEIGPCGPCTEMFIDTRKPKCGENCGPACNCGKFVEIGNNVFMEYSKTAKGKFEKLKQKNVDVGLGFERLVMFSENKESIYDIDLFAPIIKKIEEISGLKYNGENTKPFRIIADHIRAAAFILAERIEPSNVLQGYVLRRLIRRVIRYGKQLRIKNSFTFEIAEEAIKIYQDVYPELGKNENFIKEQLVKEEERFGKTLERGLKEFEKGIVPFVLFTTYGFPIELTQELAKEKGIEIDLKKFNEQLKNHQELSRTASAGMFKGGLADYSKQNIKYHTASHLVLATLRHVLGEHVFQKGSNITAERLRLDFSHPQKMTENEIKKVEELVNQKIKEDISVVYKELSLEEAKKRGATGVFEHKYGERVKVYFIGSFSQEICAGPHVNKTSELGHFKILKEESSSAGVRRIKAVLK
jgi:alanyl-tRNA synthetase